MSNYLNDLTEKDNLEKVSRTIFSYKKGNQYPTLVVFVGIHGNEPAALAAAKLVFSAEWLAENQLHGNVFVLAGNLQALENGWRFVHKDLNRIWTADNLALVRTKNDSKWPPIHELSELKALDQMLFQIIGDFGDTDMLFLDLHTTSADSCPFLPFNDSLMNRSIAERFPLPLILGIEEYLDGPLMSYINELGFPALGFEAGRHDDPYAIDKHAAFIQLSLYYWGILELSVEKKLELENALSPSSNVSPGFYEIIHRHEVVPYSDFRMRSGYLNFQVIDKGEVLAEDQAGDILSPAAGLIFMPLYQKEGNDGFFVIQTVSTLWLRVSKWLRKAGLSSILGWFPGIRQDKSDPSTYWVSPKVSRLLPKDFFHLLGYRIKRNNSSDAMRLVRRD